MSSLNSQEKSDEEASSDRLKEGSSERQTREREGRESEGGHFAENRSTRTRMIHIGSTETVKRGFLKEFCDFTREKGTMDAETLVKEFTGRLIDGYKVNATRVHRYIRYCVKNGQFKVAK